MVRCGVERNVHTYTALMNVCIKCQNCAKALETYNTMRQSGCFPNVVTYNTLIECALKHTSVWLMHMHMCMCMCMRMPQ